MERKLNGRIRIFGIVMGLILLAIASWMSMNMLYPPNVTKVEINKAYDPTFEFEN